MLGARWGSEPQIKDFCRVSSTKHRWLQSYKNTGKHLNRLSDQMCLWKELKSKDKSWFNWITKPNFHNTCLCRKHAPQNKRPVNIKMFEYVNTAHLNIKTYKGINNMQKLLSDNLCFSQSFPTIITCCWGSNLNYRRPSQERSCSAWMFLCFNAGLLISLLCVCVCVNLRRID